MKKNLKFSLELDEQGLLKAEMCGDAAEIGRELFYNFFTQWDVKPYAAGIDTALRLAYPEVYAKDKRKVSAEEQG